MGTQKKSVKTAIIPVAGMGTRLLPITKAIPKELLPIYDRPAVQHIAEEAIEAGIERIIFVIHPDKDAIKHHFTHNPKLKEQLLEKKKDHIVDHFDWLENVVKFDFAYQHEALGDGHAILQAVPMLEKGESVVVLFGDDIVDNPDGKNAVEQLLEKHEQHQSPIILLQEVPNEDTYRYGIVDIADDHHQIKTIVEKPKPAEAPSNLAVVGKYVLTPEVLQVLSSIDPHKDGEIRLSGAFESLVNDGHTIHGRPLDGHRFDTGHIDGLLEAALHFFQKSTSQKELLKKILK